MIVDGFLDDFDRFRAHCDHVDYKGTVNPVDGVLYPGISDHIPLSIRSEVIFKLGRLVRPIEKITLFMRLTTDDFVVPHQAHNDATMGEYGMILYLNRSIHVAGGTSFVRHVEEGMENGPMDKRQQAIWQRDTNRPDMWEIIEMNEMQSNRAFIFRTEQMHRAEPPSGFGSTAADGRLVMVAFFD